MKHTKIIQCVEAQDWLESQAEYNAKEKRKQMTKLNIIEKGLEGSLNLTDFVNWL